MVQIDWVGRGRNIIFIVIKQTPIYFSWTGLQLICFFGWKKLGAGTVAEAGSTEAKRWHNNYYYFLRRISYNGYK